MRRWRGGNMPSVGTAKESTPDRMGVPPFASISVHSRFSPSPSPTPLNHQARGCAIRNVGVLPQSPGLRGSPRCPGCVSENGNNRNAVVPKHRTRRCPPTVWVEMLKTNNGVAHSAGSSHTAGASPDVASAQPLWGCLYVGHGPGVAPRRRNPGLCGRIPLGFPEGDGARHDLGDSRRGTPARTTPWDSGMGKAAGSPCSNGMTIVAKDMNSFTHKNLRREFLAPPPQNVCSNCPRTEGERIPQRSSDAESPNPFSPPQFSSRLPQTFHQTISTFRPQRGRLCELNSPF